MAKQQHDYVSDIDQFFHDYDQKHPEKSVGQTVEIKKTQHVAELRDNKDRPENNNELWEDF